MKKEWSLALIFVFLIGIGAQPVSAFNSGSTGADGAFNPTVSTVVQLPESGILNYTTVNIPLNVTVTFKRNTSNTPVYMLATGDVTISGAINVNGTDAQTITPGKGGPGGFDGGIGAGPNACGGMGIGPGGGKAAIQVATNMVYGSAGGGGGYAAGGGNGSTGSVSSSTGGVGGSTYGNSAIVSLIGGSGGGGGCGAGSTAGGGGGGGGAILIASSGTLNMTGAIYANGGSAGNSGSLSGCGGGGSGGSIKLMATTLKGEGAYYVNGGSGNNYYYIGGAGGTGRIRFEANTLLRTGGTTPAYSYSSTPSGVFPTANPSLKIASIGGSPVPDYPAGQYSTPDIVLPQGAANPVDVVMQASNIPVGTTVTLNIVPVVGASSSVTTTLSGTTASSNATAGVTLSTQYASVLTASATFVIQTAANEMPLYAAGERVVKMRVVSVMGGRSSVTYITESGKEVPAEI